MYEKRWDISCKGKNAFNSFHFCRGGIKAGPDGAEITEWERRWWWSFLLNNLFRLSISGVLPRKIFSSILAWEFYEGKKIIETQIRSLKVQIS